MLSVIRFRDAAFVATVGVVAIAALEFLLGKTFDDIFTRTYWFADGVFGLYVAFRKR